VLLQIKKTSTLKKLKHPSTSTRIERPENKHFLSMKNPEQIHEYSKKRNPVSTVSKVDVLDKRVLKNELAAEEETLEDMVKRMERELDEGLEDFKNMESFYPATPAATAAVPEQRVPEPIEELQILRVDNILFDGSFIPLAIVKPTAAIVPEKRVLVELRGVAKINATAAIDTCLVTTAGRPASVPAMMPTGASATAPAKRPTLVPTLVPTVAPTDMPFDHSAGFDKSPPSIEPAKRPPPDRDKYRLINGLKGCQRDQTVSAKGVLDIGYLSTQLRARVQVPIQVWCPRNGHPAHAPARQKPTRPARDIRRVPPAIVGEIAPMR
jgi:hypothetical protein